MKKKFSFIILTLSVVFLFGCQSEGQGSDKTRIQQQVEVINEAKVVTDLINQNSFVETEEMELRSDISEIIVSESKGSVIAAFGDSNSTSELHSLLSSAMLGNGIANMMKPEYQMDIRYVDGSKEIIHLWLGKQGESSTLMKAKDTHTIYTLSIHATEKIRESIK